jgi:hypothetical protein
MFAGKKKGEDSALSKLIPADPLYLSLIIFRVLI